MVFIQGSGLTRAQIDRARPQEVRGGGAGVGWWQVALRGLFLRSRGA